ncbi:MAG: hypothetical protein K0Q59_4779 [Paenibacillus sp.]|jgi:hypothetical protein|nr:hypothetical protein [Paenibacillus sp.]
MEELLKAVIPIVLSKEPNIVLFPKTIEYYKSELTRLLERERFAEAAELLAFLLQCKCDDSRVKEEWRALLAGLRETFPHLAYNEQRASASEKAIALMGEDGEEAEEAEQDGEQSEEELLRQHVLAKAAGDADFTGKLLAMLEADSSAEKQMIVLDQLSHLDRQAVGKPLKMWLELNRIHPLVQFRGLQALRSVGETGPIKMYKLGQSVTVKIEETPLAYEQFPAKLLEVPMQAKTVMESSDVSMAELAEPTWRDFLAFLYGTTVYMELLRMEGAGQARVWACALHQSLSESMYGSSKHIRRQYGLMTGEDSKNLQKPQQVMKLFLSVMSAGVQ